VVKNRDAQLHRNWSLTISKTAEPNVTGSGLTRTNSAAVSAL